MYEPHLPCRELVLISRKGAALLLNYSHCQSSGVYGFFIRLNFSHNIKRQAVHMNLMQESWEEKKRRYHLFVKATLVFQHLHH